MSVLRWLRWLRRDEPGLDVAALATRHLLRGHSGEALLCAECVRDTQAAS